MNYELYHGDCLDVLPTLADNSVNLTVTSPPYDNLRDYGKGFSASAFNWKDIIKELYRVTVIGGVVVWVVADATAKGSETGTSFRQALWAMECGFNLHDTMIYQKVGNGSPQRRPYRRYSPAFEYMFVFSKGVPSTTNPMLVFGKEAGKRMKTKHGKNGETIKGIYHAGSGSPRQNVWQIRSDHMQRGAKQGGSIHPAKFPLMLAVDHITSWSNSGDTIFDPMMGSGTTGVACMRAGRNFVGVELDADYFALAENRIKNANNEFTPTAKEKAKGQLSIFGASK